MTNRTRYDIKPLTIKLVASPDSERAKLFKALATMKEGTEVKGEIDTTPDPTCDYNIFFDFSGFETNKEEMVKLIIGLEPTSIPIVDVNTSLFEDVNASSFQIVSCISAGYLTCSSDTLQEEIYEATGRLAAIINWPLFDTDFYEPDAKEEGELSVLWFGTINELFSIAPTVASNTKHKLTVAMPNRASIKGFKYLKDYGAAKDKVIQNSDIIYLPRTFSAADEENRMAKVEDCIMLGKFVVAPDLEVDYDGLAFDGDLDTAVESYRSTDADLTKWITEAQAVLKRRFNPEVSSDQFAFALKEAPNDEFTKNLDFYLENEKVNI